MTARVLHRWLPLLVLAEATGGAPKVQEQYDVQIVGPADRDVLAKASSVTLEVNEKEIAAGPVTPGLSFELHGNGITPPAAGMGVLRIRAKNAAGVVVAQGQTPAIELAVTTPPESYRIFVQEPGSFGRAPNLDTPRRNLIAAATLARRNTPNPVVGVTVA